MRSRQIRFMVAAVLLVMANLVAERPNGQGLSSAVFFSLLSLLLVVKSARGGRLSLSVLTGTSTVFAALMLTFGGNDPRILTAGVAFLIGAYLLWGLRRTPAATPA